MQDQRRDLRPRTFAKNNLETHDRPRFLARVVEHGLDPDQTFEKDTALAKIKGFRMVFEHGMTLVGSREDLDERVRVQGPATGTEDRDHRRQNRSAVQAEAARHPWTLIPWFRFDERGLVR